MTLPRIGHFLLVGSLLLTLACSSAKEQASVSVPLTSYAFSERDSLMAVESRPTVIFLHAEWCKFCKNMEQTTLKNEHVIQLLNEEFYFVSFDGEQRESIAFNGHNFAFRPNGRSSGTHELAAALGNIDGTLTYPTLVILNPGNEIVFQFGSFLSARQMRSVLKKAVPTQ